MMRFTSIEISDKNIFVLNVPEKLTLENSDQLRELIKEIVDDGTYRLVFDMTGTNYIDSSGLGTIISRIVFVRSHQGDIRLAIKSEFIKELLDITNFNKIMQCYDTVEDAVNSFDILN